MNIIIDPEFEGILRPLTEQEFLQLECSVLDDGLLNPLVVWVPQNILLDGHHRLRICRKHNLPFGTMPLGFDSREQALQWVGRTKKAGEISRRRRSPTCAASSMGPRKRKPPTPMGEISMVLRLVVTVTTNLKTQRLNVSRKNTTYPRALFGATRSLRKRWIRWRKSLETLSAATCLPARRA